jgi:hypothetical protein
LIEQLIHLTIHLEQPYHPYPLYIGSKNYGDKGLCDCRRLERNGMMRFYQTLKQHAEKKLQPPSEPPPFIDMNTGDIMPKKSNKDSAVPLHTDDIVARIHVWRNRYQHTSSLFVIGEYNLDEMDPELREPSNVPIPPCTDGLSPSQRTTTNANEGSFTAAPCSRWWNRDEHALATRVMQRWALIRWSPMLHLTFNRQWRQSIRTFILCHYRMRYHTNLARSSSSTVTTRVSPMSVLPSSLLHIITSFATPSRWPSPMDIYNATKPNIVVS